MATTDVVKPDESKSSVPPPYSNHNSASDAPTEAVKLTRLLTAAEDDIVAIEVRPSYAALRRKYNYSLAFNLVLIFVILPLLFIGFTLMNHNPGNNPSDGNAQANATSYVNPYNNSSNNQFIPAFALPARSVNAPQRWCITGFSPQVLGDSFKTIQKSLDKKGRIYPQPCCDVEGLDYTDGGLKVEYDYIVASK